MRITQCHHIIIALLMLLVAPLAVSDIVGKICGNTSFYAANSSYQANIKGIVATLPRQTASSRALFATASTGSIPDVVHGLALCRGDINASTCYTCLTVALEDAQQACPYDKDATVYYDYCELRYSNQDFLLNFDTTRRDFRDGWMVTNSSATVDEDDGSMSSSVFDADVNVLMTAISNHAANSSTRFATGVMQLAGGKQSKQLFGLAQCTPDMTPTNCQACLVHAFGVGVAKYNGNKSVSIHVLRCSCEYRPSSFFFGSPSIWLPVSPPTPSSTHQGSNHTVRTTVIVVATFVVALLLLVVFLYLRKRKREAYKNLELANTDRQREEDMEISEFLLYDLDTLKAATNNFSVENKLGEGGFGPVYKGTLQDGQEIAVKRLSASSSQGKVEMRNEVVLLAKLKHRNLVRLLGCCIKQHEMLLVYEFLPNNCLAKILFDPVRQRELSWGLRKKIIMGICRGLLYLHQDSRLTIIHRDLKASNILLDANMNPKISDFGLARLLNIDSSVGNTSHPGGTFGYMAPECFKLGIFSTKSDVFSFGVLLLEIITGRSNVYKPGLSSSSGHFEDLLTQVWEHWRCGNVRQLLDSCPAEGRRSQEILRYIHVDLLCVQSHVKLRPNMASIILMLDGNSTTLVKPTMPAYMDQDNTVTTSVYPSQGMTREPSINEDSISEMEPC